MRLAVAIFVPFVLLGQTPGEQSVDRILYFACTQTGFSMQDIQATIAVIANFQNTRGMPEAKGLMLHGTAGQIALAEWLFHELDGRTEPSPVPLTREYNPVGLDGIVRVFYLSHVDAMRLQEVMNAFRTLANATRVTVLNVPRAVVVRGTLDQVELAEWLVHQLDLPVGSASPDVHPEHPATEEYRRLTHHPDTAIRVFYLAHTDSREEYDEIGKTLHEIGSSGSWSYSIGPRGLSVRATREDLGLAEWLIRELDRPVGVSSDTAEHRLSGDDVARVLHPSELLPESTAEIRSKINLRRAAVCASKKALILRGTAEQIAQARRLLKE